MSLLGWGGPADAVSWIAGDDSGVGDFCTVFFYRDAGASDFDDGSAYGSACLVLKDDGVAGADIQVAVGLGPAEDWSGWRRRFLGRDMKV